MKYLGLDLGTKTLGIAISDKTNTFASPYKTIKFIESNYESIIDELIKIVQEEKISEIALGLPKNMDNSLGFASQRSLDFKELLTKYLNIPITLVDERLTTTQAEHILINADMSRKKRKKVIDSVAATIILETFIKMKGS